MVAFTALIFVSRIRKTPCSGGQTQQKNVIVLPLGQEDSRGCIAHTLPNDRLKKMKWRIACV
jgi:hypothetical protein